ncbi:uncharacterized protein LOC117973223, partial [Acipenser ruthenus]|uniref:uncharacterized protein LOC117973223 n=1 Tax=Acipenser ruthenus TaxID=7906 RepID=UPI0027410C19
MAAATVAIQLGLLHMRLLQAWLNAFHLNARRDKHRRLTVSRTCSAALRWWRVPSHLCKGVKMGVILNRQVVTTDASSQGWGAVWQGKGVSGSWPDRWASLHVNILELWVVFLALQHFLPVLSSAHVLIRTDSTTVVAYINHQGGLRSPWLHCIAFRLLIWAQANLLSLRATHIPGVVNLAADLLSRRGPHPSEWRLHPQTVERIWERFRKAQVDLFASAEMTHCPLWYTLHRSGESPVGQRVSSSSGPKVAQEDMVCDPVPDAGRPALGDPASPGSPHSGTGLPLAPESGQVPVVALAPERDRWLALGLSDAVVSAMQNARADSTRSVYTRKWKRFQAWCLARSHDPVACPMPVILQFLQELFDAGRSPSTLKVYLAAISACHTPVDSKSPGAHFLATRFLKGARRLHPPRRTVLPEWSLNIVLEALTKAPFEPLDSIELKYLSMKTAFLLANTSAKRVSELQALSVHSSCMRVWEDGSIVSLRTNPAFLPKVITAFHINQTVELESFHPPPFTSQEDEKLNFLCPVWALRFYVLKTKALRKSNQLFVCYGTRTLGQPLSKQRLSHWIADTVSTAYGGAGLPPPGRVAAHSTRGLATSWTLFKGASISEICAVASWATPHTFTRFYRI